jgi:hypothetical protein
MPPLSFASAEGSLATLARWTLPLLFAVTAGSARAAEPAKLNFSVLDSAQKPFLIGFFNVILDDLVFQNGQVSLPKAISLQGPVGIDSLVITPTVSASPPGGYISWSGNATPAPAPDFAKFSIFSPQFLALANTQTTWRSLGGNPASSFDLETGPGSTDTAYAALVQSGVASVFRKGPLVLKFETIATPPGSVGDPLAVPGPLPLLGTGVAFGFSRRLRRRISS